MKPSIAIPVPTSRDLEYNLRSWPQYAAAVEFAGGNAVRIELGSTAELRSRVSDYDGFLLPGSPADLRPSRYGEPTDPQSAPADQAREECDDLLLTEAECTGKPLLGICFGLQSINVWHGGSLIQDLLPLPVNHGAGREVAVAHSILIAADTALGRLVADSEATAERDFLRLPVNTSHHQAVAVPGAGLQVAARCPEDGVIEALEIAQDTQGKHQRFLLGVQWHPERSVELSATSRALFRYLVEQAVPFADQASAK